MGVQLPPGLCRVCAQPTGDKKRKYCPLHRKSKWRAVPTHQEGVRYDSKREAKRAGELARLLAHGLIRDLRRQVPFRLEVNGTLVTTYKADFVYWDEALGREVVEDVKGKRTPEYKIKAALFAALKGHPIQEV